MQKVQYSESLQFLELLLEWTILVRSNFTRRITWEGNLFVGLGFEVLCGTMLTGVGGHFRV